VSTGPSPAPGAVGLIGLGQIGQVHAAAVRQSRAARLVADAEVGTVSVCLPHYLHFPVALGVSRRPGVLGMMV
jgi:predicted dehydrogenase